MKEKKERKQEAGVEGGIVRIDDMCV